MQVNLNNLIISTGAFDIHSIAFRVTMPMIEFVYQATEMNELLQIFFS